MLPVDGVAVASERRRVAEAGRIERHRGEARLDERARRDLEKRAVAAEAERVPEDERDPVRRAPAANSDRRVGDVDPLDLHSAL